jgi:signal transduction histidine kinase
MLKYLVNDMIDLFALKTNRFRKQEAPTHLRLEVTDVIEDIFKEPCSMRGLSFKVNVTKNVPENLYLDVFRIKQIFINLLQNALKFTYSGGITVELDYEKKSQFLTGKVSDTGIGIK